MERRLFTGSAVAFGVSGLTAFASAAYFTRRAVQNGETTKAAILDLSRTNPRLQELNRQSNMLAEARRTIDERSDEIQKERRQIIKTELGGSIKETTLDKAVYLIGSGALAGFVISTLSAGILIIRDAVRQNPATDSN